MKTDQPAPLLLFYASRHIGGGEAYFINLGLAAIGAGRRCVVVDYDDGYVISRIPGAEHVAYTDELGADYLPACEAFMPVGAVTFLGSKLRLSPESKVLMVSIHHNHAVELGNWAWLLRRFRPQSAGSLWPLLEPCRFRKIKKFFQTISRRKGLVYCAPFQRHFDESYLSLTLEAEVVPIPVPLRSSVVTGAESGGQAIVWVSRLAKEKAAIVFEIIRAMKDSRCRRKLVIIGEGESMQDIRNRATEAGVEIETPGVIYGASLDEYLRREAFLCIGVGTTAVEMSMAGLPTLVARLPGYCDGPFIWFNDAHPGDTIVTPDTVTRAVSLAEALRQLHPQDDWARFAQNCQQAASLRHDLAASWARLSEALRANELTAEEAVELARMDQQPFRLIRDCKLWLRRRLASGRP